MIVRPDFPGASIHPSPNFGTRLGTDRPDMLILHYTGMRSGALAEDWLADPRSGVSCHYVVHEDGRVVQMVAERDRAWHAGKSSWRGEADINSRSIGIEIVNPGHHLGYPDFPETQIEAVIALCRDIRARWAIPPERVLAHSDVAPGRKIDPGEKFPWRRLHESGVGHLAAAACAEPGEALLGPGDQTAGVADLQAKLAAYGYDLAVCGRYDERTAIVVAAFQRHFRPAQVDGMADRSTLEALEALAASLR